MRTIFRIEHPNDGHGIYNSSATPKCVEWYKNMRDRHVDTYPNPRRDSMLGSIKGYEFCAFLSVEQIKSLITDDELLELIGLGFRVYEIKVCDCRVGEYQILFEKCNIFDKVDITEKML